MWTLSLPFEPASSRCRRCGACLDHDCDDSLCCVCCDGYCGDVPDEELDRRAGIT